MAVLRVSSNKVMVDPRLTINLDLSGEENEPTLELSETVNENDRQEQYVNVKRLRERIGDKAAERMKRNLINMLERLG